MRTLLRPSLVSLATLSLVLAACGGGTDTGTNGSSMDDSSSSAMADDGSMMEGSAMPLPPIIVNRADRESVAAGVLEAFARADWDTLAKVSAAQGVRFTPHTNVNVETDQTLLPEEIADFASDQTTRTWGTEDGSGLPIEMTTSEYLGRYVWDHDYRQADDVRWNVKQERGSIIDNVQQVYPGASVVEYHFDGFDESFGGMDWRSLRLVLAQNDDAQWTLYGVIHDEWAP